MDTNIVTVPVTVNVPKETKEVIDLLSVIADNILAKTPVGEWVNTIDEAMKALTGIEQVPNEVKNGDKGAVLAYLVATVGNKF